MKTFTYSVDLRNVRSDEEVFQRFYDTFKFPKSGYNWHALHDRMHNLDSDSEVCRSDGLRQSEAEVHLLIKNIDYVRRYSQQSYTDLTQVLCELTDVRQRYDGVSFTFEVQDEDRPEVSRG